MSEEKQDSDLPELPPAPQVPAPEQQPEAVPESDATASGPEPEPEVDPNNPVAKRLREMREEKARQAAAAEQAQQDSAAAGPDASDGDEEGDGSTQAAQSDPELMPSVLDAFAFPFRENGYLKILWLSFCLVAAPFTSLQMQSPFGFVIITLLFVVPIALNCRSRVMMSGITAYIFASLFLFTGMINNPHIFGWYVLLVIWFFLAYSLAFLYRILQEGAQNRPGMGPLPGFGGSDFMEEIVKPAHYLLGAILICFCRTWSIPLLFSMLVIFLGELDQRAVP